MKSQDIQGSAVFVSFQTLVTCPHGTFLFGDNFVASIHLLTEPFQEF